MASGVAFLYPLQDCLVCHPKQPNCDSSTVNRYLGADIVTDKVVRVRQERLWCFSETVDHDCRGHSRGLWGVG
jgi:hypothetical protein